MPLACFALKTRRTVIGFIVRKLQVLPTHHIPLAQEGKGYVEFLARFQEDGVDILQLRVVYGWQQMVQTVVAKGSCHQEQISCYFDPVQRKEWKYST